MDCMDDARSPDGITGNQPAIRVRWIMVALPAYYAAMRNNGPNRQNRTPLLCGRCMDETSGQLRAGHSAFAVLANNNLFCWR